ncbi:hypothetical protein DV736_g1584, partial [Chaetothyriales sp. CBS 134916]
MASVNGQCEISESQPGSGPRSDGKYQVERILAQDEADGEIMYLVKWKGYDYGKCTWELAESFETPTTISAWQEQLARGDTLDDGEVDQVLAQMDAFRSQRAELARQERPMSEDRPRESERRVAVESESDRLSPRSSAVSQSISVLTPPKIGTAPLSREDTYHDSDETVSVAVASKHPSSSASKNAEAAHLRKRHHSSADADKNFGKAQRINKVQKISSKHNQAPPPVGLIKPSEIGHREPGHTLPATPAVRQPDSFLFTDNSSTSRESMETSQSRSKSHTIHTRPTTNDSAAGSLPIPPTSTPNYASNPKELTVQLSVGSRKIGQVALTNLPKWLCKKLSTLTAANTLPLHFEQNFVVSWQQYDQISSGWRPSSRTLGGGLIHPFAEADAACQSLTRYLEKSDYGAIWVHPNPNETYALILHVSTLPHWQQTQYLHRPGQPVRLLLGVRNRVGKGQLAPPLVIPSDQRERRLGLASPPHGLDSQTHTNGTNSTEPNDDEETRKYLNISAPSNTNRQYMPLSSERKEMSTNGATAGIANGIVANVSHKGRSSAHETTSLERLEVAETSTVVKTLSVVCDLDYQSMARWTASTRPLIYIAFGSSSPTEAQEVAKWAVQYTLPRLVFIEGQDRPEWQEFCKMCGGNPALLLFSDEPDFCNLLSLGSLLGKYNAQKLVSFRLCWQTSDPQLPKYTPTQIFNHGTVLLLTEATMKHTTTAVKILKWFRQHSKGKSNKWMVMVRPNIRAWLTRQAVHATDDDPSAHYIEMLTIFSELMPAIDVTEMVDMGKFGSLKKNPAITRRLNNNYVIPLTHLPGYDSSPAADEAQVRRRDEILLSHFVGWSTMHAENHRRFLVLDDDKANKGRAPDIYENAHHILFMKAAGFIEDQERSERHKRKN